MADVAESTSALSEAINLLNTETDSLLVKFGQVSDKSKVWNIASRILSGSGLWKLQNRIRAVGNVINVFSEANEEALKSQLKAWEAHEKMEKTLRKLGDAKDKIAQIDKEDIRVKALRLQGMGREEAIMRVQNDLREKYEKTEDALQKKVNKSMKLSRAGEFLRGGKTLQTDGEGGQGWKESKGPGAFTTNEFKRAFDRNKFARKQFRNWRKNMSWEKVRDKFGKKLSKVGKLVDIAFSFLMKFMMYLLLATLVIMLLRNAWPTFKDALEKIGGIKQYFTEALEGVKQILMGVWKVLSGVFQGDFRKVFSGLADIFLGVWKVAFAGIKIVIKIIIATLMIIPMKIIDGLKWLWEKVKEKLPKMPKRPKWLGGKAGGGPVNTGGMAIVGERGPELVTLPGGSRIHSNRQSMGNTIHVHVDGRVGASDAEIRDIANKVAREINMRMNRTGNTMGAF